MEWTMRQLGLAGFRMCEARRFPIRYRARFVHGQMDMCVDRVERMPEQLRASMHGYIEDLRARALALDEREGGLRHGCDYVIAAETM